MRLLFSLLALLVLGFSQPLLADDTKVISGIVLLNDKSAPDFTKLLKSIHDGWLVPTDSISINGKTAVFSTPGATVMLAYLDYPISPDDIHIASGISWLWRDAEKEAGKHKGQLLVSVLGDPAKTIELYRIFTRVAAGAMAVLPQAPGIYMDSQYLILSKGYYMESARNMGREGLPLYCWVYFGILGADGNSAGYTYGLSEFGIPEFEIVDSKLPVQDAHSLLYEVAQKAVAAPVKWVSGQTIALEDDRKVTVKRSPAKYIGEGGETMKVE